MIVVRNVFHLKFGKAREALVLFKESLAIQERLGTAKELPTRILTDVTGAFYTVVLEITAPSLAEFEAAAPRIMGHPEWQSAYRKLTDLIESGSREIYTVVD